MVSRLAGGDDHRNVVEANNVVFVLTRRIGPIPFLPCYRPVPGAGSLSLRPRAVVPIRRMKEPCWSLFPGEPELASPLCVRMSP